MRHGIAVASTALTALLLLTGWGISKSKGNFDYLLPQGYLSEQTAIIRPAAKEEMREGKPNLAKRLFVHGAGSQAKLMAISTGDEPDVKLAEYDSVRTMAGVYNLNVRCTRGGYHGYFIYRLVAVAGGEYLFECVGSTAHTMTLVMVEKRSGFPTLDEAGLRSTP